MRTFPPDKSLQSPHPLGGEEKIRSKKFAKCELCPCIQKSAMKRQQWTAEENGPAGPDPVRLLDKLMKQRKLRPVDLAAELGISESLLSDIRAYRRALSKEVIRKLAARFEVDQERFNRPYNLVTQRKPSGRTGSRPQKDPPPKKGPRDSAILELLQSRTGMPTIARKKNGSSITIWNIMWSYFIGSDYAHISTNIKPAIEGEKIDIFFTSDIEELIDPATGDSIGHGAQ
jgi:antitoxin component HigA of HigAB toxin-antitoxin module